MSTLAICCLSSLRDKMQSFPIEERVAPWTFSVTLCPCTWRVPRQRAACHLPVAARSQKQSLPAYTGRVQDYKGVAPFLALLRRATSSSVSSSLPCRLSTSVSCTALYMKHPLDDDHQIRAERTKARRLCRVKTCSNADHPLPAPQAQSLALILKTCPFGRPA